MSEIWRLLLTGQMDASSNMAMDEAVLRLNSGKEVGTLRFYSWEPKAISIGYFQGINEEVNVARCRKYGVDVVRRITGGGAVYHDDELTYSLIVNENNPKIPKNILESYGTMCKGIILGLDRLEIPSEFKPINDIISGGKKISGNAQTRQLGNVLQHGTILQDVDVKTMFQLLLVPDEKIRDKMISAVEERVTSIRHILGRKIEPDKILQAMKAGFSEALDVELVRGEPTVEEWALMKKIREEKYGADAWNFKR